MEYFFVPPENKKIFIINKLVQTVLLAVLLLFGCQLSAHQVDDNWCWCLTENIEFSDSGKARRVAGNFFLPNSNDKISYTFRFIQVSRCGSVDAKEYYSVNFGACDRPQKPAQVAFEAPGGHVKYLYFAYMKPSFFQTFTPERKALLLRENPCLDYSDDLFDKTVREVWHQILGFWEQPEKKREVLEQPYSTSFRIVDYVFGFSPPPDVYRFPRNYAVSPDSSQPEERFVLGKPLEVATLVSQLGVLKVGQVWFLEELGDLSAGIYNKYNVCVVYIGGGIFLLPLNRTQQHFLNVDDFFKFTLNTLRFNGKYQWRRAMVRTSNGAEPFSLKMQGAHPVSVTDFLYKEVKL